jgi:hypothetical protein
MNFDDLCNTLATTYDHIKQLEDKHCIEGKIIAGILANSGIKFRIEESNLSNISTIDFNVIDKYINQQITETEKMLDDNIELKKSTELLLELHKIYNIKKNYKDNLELLNRFIPLEHRILLNAFGSINLIKFKHLNEINKSNIEEVIIIMAIANTIRGPTHFKF